MKRLILVSAMILGLAATGALASQNKNSKPASKPVNLPKPDPALIGWTGKGIPNPDIKKGSSN